MKCLRFVFISIITFTLLIGFFWSAAAADKVSIEKTFASPDNEILLTFSLTDGIPAYAVSYKNHAVLLTSKLGFELKDGDLKSGFALLDTTKSSEDETWTQPWGEQREVSNHYNELAVTLQQVGDQGRKLRIIFRVFDDAIAFRYEWPEQTALKDFDIMDELTEFVLPPIR